MPKPKKGEKKNHYISRCVSMVMGEGKTQDQALGQCYGMWKQYKKESVSNESIKFPKFSEFSKEEKVIENPIKEDWKFSGLVEVDVNGEKKYVPVYDK